MLMAAECCIRLRGAQAVFCAKLHRDNDRRCIFCESRSESLNEAKTIVAERNRQPAHASNRVTA
jgi:hypothetical protein